MCRWVYVCGVCVDTYMCVYMCAGVFVCRCVYICVCVGSRTMLVADPDCPLISRFHSTYPPLQQQLEWTDCPLCTVPGPGTTQVSEIGFSFWGFLHRLYQLNIPHPKFWNRKCCPFPNVFEHRKGPESFDLQSVWDFSLFFSYWSSGLFALGTWFVFTVPFYKGSSSSSSCLNPRQVPNARLLHFPPIFTHGGAFPFPLPSSRAALHAPFIDSRTQQRFYLETFFMYMAELPPRQPPPQYH